MMKKRSGITAALAAAALALTGFAVPAHADGKTLTIWADASRTPVIKKLVASWAQSHHVTVNVVTQTDVNANFQAAAAKGVGPDLVIGAHDWTGTLAASGLVAPITGLQTSAFDPQSINAFSYNGKLWGVPFGTENIALVTNLNLVPTGAPTTWASLESTALALKASGKTTSGLFIPCGGANSCDPYHHAFLNFGLGGYIFKQNGKRLNPKDVGLASSTFLSNAALVDKWVSEGLISKEGATGDDYNFKTFFTNKAPFMITGPWELSAIKASGVPYQISMIPNPLGSGNAAPFAGYQGVYLSQYSNNKATARQFITQVIATDTFQLGLYNDQGRPPALLSSIKSISSDKDLAGFAAAGVGATPMPNIPQMGSVWTDFGNAWGAVLTGKLKTADAFKQAQANIAKLIG
jgi:arabinogalactan oligomer / maltooligosaccharide transport system substrate-binding protein